MQIQKQQRRGQTKQDTDKPLHHFDVNHNPTKYYPKLDSSRLVEAYLHKIYNRVHRMKFNYLALVTGKHRTGKSLTAVTLSYLLDKTFWDDFENRVVYTGHGFMEACEHLRKNNIIGGAIVFDEAGVGAPSREWWSKANRAISYAVQVFGYLRPIIFWVTQDASFLDSQPRKLLDTLYVCNRVHHRYNEIKPYDVHYDKRTGKIYWKYPRFKRVQTGAICNMYKLTRIQIPKPPQDLIERYDKHSEPWKGDIMDKMAKVTEPMTEGNQKFEKMSNKERAEWVVQHLDEHPAIESKRSKPGNRIFNPDVIVDIMGITHRDAKTVKHYAETMASQQGSDAGGDGDSGDSGGSDGDARRLADAGSGGVGVS